jgi:hypothetical protein
MLLPDILINIHCPGVCILLYRSRSVYIFIALTTLILFKPKCYIVIYKIRFSRLVLKIVYFNHFQVSWAPLAWAFFQIS